MILQQLEQLPTLPSAAVRVLEVTGNEESSTDDVVRLIESDPSLAARILQLVHRADAGVSGEVASIQRAVVLLGFDAVRSAVLAISVLSCFPPTKDPKKGAAAQFNKQEFWRHSIAVGCCAELLAEQLRRGRGADAEIDAGEAFVCGLLHDIGKVALDAALPKSFQRVVEAAELLRGNIADLERTIIGLDHMVVGKRLAERWRLPTTIRECIWLHGQNPAALPATVRDGRLVNLITLADELVREQHLGYSGNYSFAPARQAIASAAGVEEKQIQQVLKALVGRIETRARTLGLGESSSENLYQQALLQANRELGRVSVQLASRNRRLATRAKFFDALSEFQSELRPDAPSQHVIAAIGQTAVQVLDVKAACIFTLPPGQNYAEAMLFDHAGACFQTMLVDCASRPRRGGGEGPVLSAAQEMEWLLGMISPRLAEDQRYWICLEADGQCVGGVVWGAAQGESQRLSPQAQELTAISAGWSLALRTAQIREEARALAEQLADANRRLQTAQNEVLRTRTMVSVGEMAAGAAHEMNNPLTNISMRAQKLAGELPDTRQKQIAQTIVDNAQRASDIITELMAYAKPTAPRPLPTDLADMMDKALRDARSRCGGDDRKIELTMSEAPAVLVDPDQVGDAIVEIVVNAIQATGPEDGTISIHAGFDPYTSRAVLTIGDSGRGMDEHTVRHAFDPFFSSRPAGRRRGMGLAKALRWIEGSGGSIRLESRLGQGTRVVVLLPAAVSSAKVEPGVSADAGTAVEAELPSPLRATM